MRTTVLRTVTIAVTSLALLTGCTTLHTGVGVRDPHPSGDAINASLLDTGKFPTKPHAPFGKAGTTAVGSLIEARRMADMVVVPFEVDPVFEQDLEGVKPFNKPAQLTESTGDLGVDRAMAEAIEDHNLVAGFATLGVGDVAGSSAKCRNVVMRFSTPQDATDALAAVVARAPHERYLPTYERQEQSITGYPAARAYRETDTEKNKFRSIYTYIVRGQYLVANTIGAETVDQAVKYEQALLDKQLPMIDGFQATPVDDLPNLPRDQDDLLAHTVPLPKTSKLTAMSGLYGRHGTLHFIPKPLRDVQLFDDADLQMTAIGITRVLAAGTPAGAESIATDIATQYAESGPSYDRDHRYYSVDEPVSGIPNTRCLKPENKYKPFICTGNYDRFAIVMVSKDRDDTRRALAAQYVMLAAK